MCPHTLTFIRAKLFNSVLKTLYCVLEGLGCSTDWLRLFWFLVISLGHFKTVLRYCGYLALCPAPLSLRSAQLRQYNLHYWVLLLKHTSAWMRTSQTAPTAPRPFQLTRSHAPPTKLLRAAVSTFSILRQTFVMAYRRIETATVYTQYSYSLHTVQLVYMQHTQSIYTVHPQSTYSTASLHAAHLKYIYSTPTDYIQYS